MWRFRTKREALESVNRFGHAVARYGSRWVIVSDIHPTCAVGDHGWLYEMT